MLDFLLSAHPFTLALMCVGPSVIVASAALAFGLWCDPTNESLQNELLDYDRERSEVRIEVWECLS